MAQIFIIKDDTTLDHPIYRVSHKALSYYDCDLNKVIKLITCLHPRTKVGLKSIDGEILKENVLK